MWVGGLQGGGEESGGKEEEEEGEDGSWEWKGLCGDFLVVHQL